MDPMGSSRATSWVDVTDPRRKTFASRTIGKLPEAVKIHRTIVLVVMMVIAAGAFVLLTAAGIANFDGRSLIALLVVVAAAAISGIAFSWKRYSRRS